jgi:hypothetical protein
MKRLKPFYSIVIILFISLAVRGQEIKAVNVKEKEFPTFNGELIVRNPSGIDPSRVIFYEGDSVLNVLFEKGVPAKIQNESKEVLFLVLNHQGHRDRTKWYQNIISEAIASGLIHPGDRYSIQSFDCQRPEYNEPKKQLLFPETPFFVGNSKELQDQVNGIELVRKKFLNSCIERSDIYGAIFEALETFHKMPIESGVSRSIVVFADDFSLVTKIGQDNVIARSREYDIPIYGITYWQNNQNKYGIEPICEATYGKFHVDKTRDKSLAINELLSITEGMSGQAAGISYSFTFNSPFEKDGLKHGVKVTYNKEFTPLSYDSPKMTFDEWIFANPIISACLFVAFIILIVSTILLVKKNKKKKEEKEQQHAVELSRMESLQSESDRKVAKQEEEIEKIRQLEIAKETAQEQATLKAQYEAENTIKLQQMKAKGNLPWFTFVYQGQNGSFEVNYPDFTVGRDLNNNYRINLPIISRQHFKIEFEAGLYKIIDLGSSNGLLLNGQKVSTALIKHGDVVAIGEIQLTFHV